MTTPSKGTNNDNTLKKERVTTFIKRTSDDILKKRTSHNSIKGTNGDNTINLNNIIN